ncbi:MAG: hypothetical protein ABT07_03825 [Microbacterium sp. SCN 70-10]|nr:MAG: hypothetical protein ABT07_03825 [Microbacterium sp. SCN 70-10]
MRGCRATGGIRQREPREELVGDTGRVGHVSQAGRALERYVLNLGPTDDSDALIRMVTDLADLLEQAAAADTPIRDLMGAEPSAFAEEFMANYGDGSWIGRERARLARAIDEAARTQG